VEGGSRKKGKQSRGTNCDTYDKTSGMEEKKARSGGVSRNGEKGLRKRRRCRREKKVWGTKGRGKTIGKRGDSTKFQKNGEEIGRGETRYRTAQSLGIKKLFGEGRKKDKTSYSIS